LSIGMPLWLKNIVFTLIVPGTVGGWLPWWLGARSTPAVDWTWHHWLAFPFLLTGAAIYGWCLWDFMKTGRGTPAPIDPPQNLVVRGLYRFVRNPMYYGVLNAITGWIVFFGSVDVLIYGVIVAIAFDLFVRYVEEPGLRDRFGEDYERYCAAVRRWLPGKPYLPSRTSEE
jgi:protein-S-isoprenylcysteine O-methyltransferase Ste14